MYATDPWGVVVDLAGPEDLNCLWLPPAHAFGKVMLALALLMSVCTVIDGRVDRIVDNLVTSNPTVTGAVACISEKAHAGIEVMIAEQGGVNKSVFDWAIRLGRKVSREGTVRLVSRGR